MSDVSAVMRHIADMADTSSRSEKERILGELVKLELGKFALKWAYDPFVTYGLTPSRREEGSALELVGRETLFEPLLRKLASRELSGNAAQREVAEVMNSLEPQSAELLFLILSKDLKCGIAETTIGNVIPGLIPVFSVMRAHKFEEKRIKKWPQILEPKLDGYRFTFLCRDGFGGFFTRSGKRAPAADHLIEPMIEAAVSLLQNSKNDDLRFLLNPRAGSLGRYARDDLNFMVDGEMMMPGNFNETGALRRQSATAQGATFNIFDIMSYAHFDAVGSVGKPYLERRALLEEFVRGAANPAIKHTPRYFANSFAEIHQLYESFRANGLEGAMVKSPDGLYDKKKSYSWLKMKAEESEDLPIVGAFPGEPNTKYSHCLGGLIVKRANGVEVRVGGGFSDRERHQLWSDWSGKTLVFTYKNGDGDDVHEEISPSDEELTGRLIEVLYHEETPDGSLRHPRYLRFRDDKAGEVETKEAA